MKKKYIIIGACVVFAVILILFGTKALAPTPEVPFPTTPVSTAPEHISIEDFEDPECNFRYILTTPKNARENMPLIVYLHGENGKGNNPNALLQLPGFPKAHVFGELAQIDAYVLIPQLPADENAWHVVMPALIKLIDQVAEETKADTAKIALTGHGMGGTGAWRLAATYPDKFSCVVPISGSIPNMEMNRIALKDMPIRAFAGDGDTIPPSSYTTEFVAALSGTNPNCTATILAGHTQETTWDVYKSKEYDIFQWMISQ